MPKQNNNIVMHSTRGMFGKQVVFKRRGGESYVSAPPEIKPGRKPTEAQLAIQQRFKSSTEYANEAIKDPEIKKIYQAKAKGNQMAHNVAVLDAFYPPVVLEITAAAYQGQIGNVISLQAEDDFKVTEVKVTIHNAAGDLIEEGLAVQGKRLLWTYTVTQANANIAGTKIKAIAKDLANNEGTLEETV